MRDQVNVKFPDEMKERIDHLVKNGRYMNRQELIRDAVRCLLKNEEVVVEVPQ